jgi:hypothetical protein
MIPDKEMIVLLLEEVGFMEIARDAMLEDNKDILDIFRSQRLKKIS